MTARPLRVRLGGQSVSATAAASQTVTILMTVMPVTVQLDLLAARGAAGALRLAAGSSEC